MSHCLGGAECPIWFSPLSIGFPKYRAEQLNEFLKARLKHMEGVLVGRKWLSSAFSIADILMADVLRLVERFEGLQEVARLSRLCRVRQLPAILREGARGSNGPPCCCGCSLKRPYILPQFL
jgi:glutathione S-transferase